MERADRQRDESRPDNADLHSGLTALIPVFDDWTAASVLLEQLDAVFEENGLTAQVVFVDDHSNERPADPFPAVKLRKIQTVSIIELRKNLGHQRALCVGLVYLQGRGDNGPVLILDADGEDSPADIPVLLKEYVRHGGRKAVFAARARRTEGLPFKFFYQLYRSIHRILVGFDIRVGNFSIVPPALLDSLVVAPELWNHYAAAVAKGRYPSASVPIDRAKRISGRSRMGFIGLVVHGLSAMSVFGDSVGVRLLIASGALAALTAAFLAAVLVIRLATPWAVPGWATYTSGLLLVLLAQWLMLSLIFTFVVLYSRGQSNFVPTRDCPIYVKGVKTVFARDT